MAGRASTGTVLGRVISLERRIRNARGALSSRWIAEARGAARLGKNDRARRILKRLLAGFPEQTDPRRSEILRSLRELEP